MKLSTARLKIVGTIVEHFFQCLFPGVFLGWIFQLQGIKSGFVTEQIIPRDLENCRIEVPVSHLVF